MYIPATEVFFWQGPYKQVEEEDVGRREPEVSGDDDDWYRSRPTELRSSSHRVSQYSADMDTYTHTHMYAYIYIYIYIHTHTHTYIYIYTCMYFRKPQSTGGGKGKIFRVYTHIHPCKVRL
jgi:hypothetical protein